MTVPPAIEFDRVSISFDDHVVLRDLTFSIPKGDMRILLGRSGSGKSVLLKLILGLLRPDAGTVTVNGQRRRVAIGRAMAPVPGILLFDDPITGLDPLIATTIDSEIIKVRDLEQATSIVVTHQIRDAFYIATHEAERHAGGVRIVPIPISGYTCC